MTPKLVKKVIAALHESKASGPDCIAVDILKNCKPDLSYILAEHFDMCLKEFCFPGFWKISYAVPEFKNVEERSAFKKPPPC